MQCTFSYAHSCTHIFRRCKPKFKPTCTHKPRGFHSPRIPCLHIGQPSALITPSREKEQKWRLTALSPEIVWNLKHKFPVRAAWPRTGKRGYSNYQTCMMLFRGAHRNASSHSNTEDEIRYQVSHFRRYFRSPAYSTGHSRCWSEKCRTISIRCKYK